MNSQQEVILDNYKNPQNTGDHGWEPTHSAKSQNLSCGDSIEMKLLIEDGKLKDLRFVGEGCSIAIASASILSQEIKGKDIKDIEEMNVEDVLSLIGIDLTMSRQKCAMLSLDAIQNALNTKKS